MLIYSSDQKNLVEALKKDHWHNELIQKYLNYTQSKQRVIKTGRTAWNDSGKSKTYKAEWKFQAKFKYDIVDFDNTKEAHKYMKRILKSKLWAELCGGDAIIPTLDVISFRGRTAGRAYGYRIELCNERYGCLHSTS